MTHELLRGPEESPARRAAIIAGLRELAGFLESHPEIPTGRYTFARVGYAPWSSDNEVQRAEVDRVAALLGVAAEDEGSGRYGAVRTFGAAKYHVYAYDHEA